MHAYNLNVHISIVVYVLLNRKKISAAALATQSNVITALVEIMLLFQIATIFINSYRIGVNSK